MTESLLEYQCDVTGVLHLNSFWGGEKKGRCVQLTPESGGYVQMTFDDALRFFRKAIREIKKVEKRYDEDPPWWEQISQKRREEEAAER